MLDPLDDKVYYPHKTIVVSCFSSAQYSTVQYFAPPPPTRPAHNTCQTNFSRRPPDRSALFDQHSRAQSSTMETIAIGCSLNVDHQRVDRGKSNLLSLSHSYFSPFFSCQAQEKKSKTRKRDPRHVSEIWQSRLSFILSRQTMRSHLLLFSLSFDSSTTRPNLIGGLRISATRNLFNFLFLFNCVSQWFAVSLYHLQ